MSGEEFLAAVESLRDVSVVRLQPGDVVVLRSSEVLPAEAVERITELLRGVWPEHRVLVLEGGMTLETVRACEV